MTCPWWKRLAFGIYVAAIIPAVAVWVWWDFLVVERDVRRRA